jgi:hypothetical protein
MAIDDPESSSAETRAWERWHNAPWSEAVALAARKQESLFTPIEMQEAFRHGFRAGQEHGKPVLMSSGSYRDGFAKGAEASGNEALLRKVHALEKSTGAQTLSFDQRLAVLEREAKSHYESLVQHASRLAVLELWRQHCSTAIIPFPADLLARLEALEKREHDAFRRGHEAAELGEPLPEWRSSINKRLSVVEQSVGAPEANMLAKALEQMRGRLSALEDKLRLQEPIG